MKSRIGFKLVVALVLFSSLITLITTALQLYLEYRVDIKRVDNYEVLIRESYLKSITASVWLYNDKQIRTQLHGLLQLPDMEHIQIHSDEGAEWTAGSVKSKNKMTKEFPLLYEHKGKLSRIGVLTAVVSLDNIYTRLFKKAFTILLGNAVKTFLVSGFILLIFQYLFTRHLYSLSSWLRNLDIGRSVEKFRLDRTIRKSNKTDELDEVVIAINEMQDNIKNYLSNLIKSEENYKSIFENAVEGLFQSTPEGRFISVNPAFARMLGYASPEELVSSISDIAKQYYVNNEDRHRYEQLLQTAGFVEAFECRVRCKGGSHIWVSDSTRAIYDQDGKITRYEGNVTDITKRKQAEITLRESEEKFRNFTEQSFVGFYIIQDDLFKYVNPKFASIFGYTVDECIDSMFFRQLVHPEDLTMVQEQVRRRETEKVKAVQYIFRGVKKTGEVIHVEIYGSSLIFNGKPAAIGTMLDITKKMELEKLVSQSQRMESIGTLAGGIAHDFNNILFPIVGHTEILLEDNSEDSPLRESLNEIYTGALRARDLVQQILAFSRQEKSELKLMKMQPIIKEALKLIRSTIPTTISINQNLQSDCGVVEADPTQIHQMVMNLTTNAYHAMEKNGGELKVTLKEIRLDRHELINPEMNPGSYACLTIADTGVGMDKKVIDKIFEPFFTTKEKGKGTGMGLSVVHGIVKSMNGVIQVYSEPGKGTEFHIFLPIVKSAFEKQEIQTKETLPEGIERILLVDDEKSIIVMERQALERLGYHVTSRTDSIEALEIFRSDPEKFDIIISDMAMPKMPGDKLAVELIKIKPDIPILLCTGFSETMTEERAASLGIKSLLLKPVIIKDLAQKIREVLDGK